MATLTRRTFLGGAVAASSVLVLGDEALAGHRPQPRRSGEVVTRLVSIPDFLNSDLADIAGRYPQHVDRYGNSISRDQRANVNHVLDTLASYQPAAVLVAGDLVEGGWGTDPARTGIFGPVGTDAERNAALREAADTYYSSWASRFRVRGLRVLPAVGDHERGDNGTDGWHGYRLRAQPEFAAAFARHFTLDGETPVYADRPVGTPHELTCYGTGVGAAYVLSVDVFNVDDDAVRTEVSPEVAAWMDASLSAARANGATVLIVQGHCPVIGPVRRRHSSGLMMRGATDSLFWRVLRDNDVELYLCGEAHDVTAYAETGTAQISHGSLVYRGENVNFLVIDVLEAGGIDLTLKQWDQVRYGNPDEGAPAVWALDPTRAAGRNVGTLAGSTLRTAGTMHLGPANVATRRTRLLREGIQDAR